VACDRVNFIHIPHQELSAVLHSTEQFIMQSFYTIIDDGLKGPKHVRVSGFHKNIVDRIEFCVFVGSNDGD
jgi:hypothetical protein